MKFAERYDGIVVGAGVAGLTAAVRMAQAGLRVLVMERHNVAGGCASFYQRGGYRFDVGATLVGGFGRRGVHSQIFSELGVQLVARRLDPAMVVYLGKQRILRYGDARWRAERIAAFGAEGEAFWRKQERLADLAWDFSGRMPALPVDASGLRAFVAALRPAHLGLLPALGKTLASIMPPGRSALRAFVDVQLLITAQCDADAADLAYAATALDLAREGTYHLDGGVAAISTALARSLRRLGGSIGYGIEAARAIVERGRVRGVEIAGGQFVPARSVVLAVPVQNAAELSADIRDAFGARIAALPQRWGAFMAYVGLPAEAVPADTALHHQVVLDPAAALGEGNSVFISLSAADESARARNGGRAVTLSTHTDVALWERAEHDGDMERLRADYVSRLLRALERALPGSAERALLVESATPLTFARYTGRSRGLVGGLPQTPALATLGAFSHHTPVRGLFLCGDTTFPGQSTVGATLSGNAAGRAAAG
jgi:C-3',4' desaturase CrtD